MNSDLSLYIFTGPPGCGKGTQAKLLAPYSFFQISTGDLLRSALAQDSKRAQNLKKTIGSGGLVDDEIVFELLKEALTQIPQQKSVILDGFPRTLEQAKMLEEIDVSCKKVVNFKINDEILYQRITGRFSCTSCFALYNDFTKPTKKQGVCDACGEKNFSRRLDDSRDILKNRLQSYHNETMLLEKYYSDIMNMDASLSVDDLHKEICRRLNIQKVD
jgi:adenylate kinase